MRVTDEDVKWLLDACAGKIPDGYRLQNAPIKTVMEDIVEREVAKCRGPMREAPDFPVVWDW